MKIRNTLAAVTPLSSLGLALYALAANPPGAAIATDRIPQLINSDELKWVKTIPEAGDKSPEYAILHANPKTHLTMLMFRTPVPVHIKAHTHTLAETHVVLAGGRMSSRRMAFVIASKKAAISECREVSFTRLGFPPALRRSTSRKADGL